MYIKFLVLFVASIASWQIAKSFVIKDQQPVVNVTEFAYVVFNSVSTNDDNVSSAIVIDEDGMPPVQSVEEEKNETMNVKDDDNKFNVEIAIEQVAISSLDIKEETQTFVHDDKDVDDAQSTVEYEEKKVKNENSDEARTSSGDSDEEQKKFHHGKYFQHEEDNEDEQEDDENTNKENHDNDE